MNCNSSSVSSYPGNFLVSIPNRDFDELQFFFLFISHIPSSVSIPNRDFDELQSFERPVMPRVRLFQSLIGILMNCNILCAVNARRIKRRFNP